MHCQAKTFAKSNSMCRRQTFDLYGNCLILTTWFSEGGIDHVEADLRVEGRTTCVAYKAASGFDTVVVVSSAILGAGVVLCASR